MNPDAAIFFWLNDLAGRWWLLDEWWRLWANDYVVPSILVALVGADWFTRDPSKRVALLSAVLAIGVSNILVAVSNAFWFRPRPFTANDVNLLFYYPSDSSFPSNSAAVAWAIAWVVVRASPRLRLVLLLPLLMGVARVWVGVHYPLDIAGGALLGILAGQAGWSLRARLEPVSSALVRLARSLKLD